MQIDYHDTPHARRYSYAGQQIGFAAYSATRRLFVFFPAPDAPWAQAFHGHAANSLKAVDYVALAAAAMGDDQGAFNAAAA